MSDKEQLLVTQLIGLNCLLELAQTAKMKVGEPMTQERLDSIKECMRVSDEAAKMVLEKLREAQTRN